MGSSCQRESMFEELAFASDIILSPYCVISFDWFQMFSTVFKCGVVYNYWNLWCFFDVCTKQTTRQETCNYMYIYVYIVVYVYIFFAMHVFMFSNYCKLPLSMHSIDSPKEPFRLLTYETNGWSFPTEILPNAGPEQFIKIIPERLGHISAYI